MLSVISSRLFFYICVNDYMGQFDDLIRTSGITYMRSTKVGRFIIFGWRTLRMLSIASCHYSSYLANRQYLLICQLGSNFIGGNGYEYFLCRLTKISNLTKCFTQFLCLISVREFLTSIIIFLSFVSFGLGSLRIRSRYNYTIHMPILNSAFNTSNSLALDN